MQEKRRERGSTLAPEQRTFIDEKLREEGLSIKAAAAKYEIAEGTLRNALNGKYQDYTTLEDLMDRLGVPDVKGLLERHRRLFNIPRERNTYFTGREEVLKTLCQALETRPFAAVTQALCGLGGAGKTATAVEYAYRCLDRANYKDYPHYKAIQFVRADTTEVLKEGYAGIAHALQLPTTDPNNRDEAVRAVIQWMTQPENGPWLLILDNLDEEPDRIKAFLPQAPQRHYGHILITSRSHRFGHQVKRVDLTTMDDEEAVTFLYHRTERARLPGSPEEQAAKALVGEMGGLPLALEQASAYMTNGVEMSFADYVTSFRDQRLRCDQMSYPPEYGFYEFTVRTTWNLNLARIEPFYPEAVQLLQFCAFLHPIGIPRELVVALLPDYFASAGEDVEAQKALYNSLLTVLTGYSLIQRNLNNDTHSIHVMVQTALRDSLPPDTQKRMHEWVIKAIAGSFPSSFPSDDNGLTGRCALYFPHAERLSNYVERNGLEGEEVGRLLHHIGRFLFWQASHQAERHLQRALAMRQKILPADHPDIVESLNALGLWYDGAGSKDAEPLYHQALKILQSTRPEGHPDIATCLNNLAAFYRNQGRFADAEPLFKQSIAMHRNTSLVSHSGLAFGLNNLGSLYSVQGRFDEAEPLLKEAVAIWQNELPEVNRVIGMGLTNLANVYRDQGRFCEAEPLYKQAIRLWQTAMPEGCPVLANCLNHLARMYWNQGRFGEAEFFVRQALAMCRKVRPERHADIGKILDTFAELYRSQRRLAEAEPLYQEAESILLSSVGAEHPDYQAVHRNYLTCLVEMGKEEEAERLSPGFLAWYRETIKKEG